MHWLWNSVCIKLISIVLVCCLHAHGVISIFIHIFTTNLRQWEDFFTVTPDIYIKTHNVVSTTSLLQPQHKSIWRQSTQPDRCRLLSFPFRKHDIHINPGWSYCLYLHWLIYIVVCHDTTNHTEMFSNTTAVSCALHSLQCSPRLNKDSPY